MGWVRYAEEPVGINIDLVVLVLAMRDRLEGKQGEKKKEEKEEEEMRVTEEEEEKRKR